MGEGGSSVHQTTVLHGGITVLLSLFIGAGISFVTSIVVARSIDVEEYGVMSVVISLQAVIVLLGTFGIPRSLAKFIPEYQQRSPHLVGRIARYGMLLVLVLSILSAAVYAVLAEIIGNGLYDDPLVSFVIPYSAAVVVTASLLSALSAVAQGRQEIGLVALVRVVGPIACLAAIVSLVGVLGIRGVFIGYVLGQLFVCVVFFRKIIGNPALSGEGSHKSLDPGFSRQFLGFSSLSFLSTIVVIPGIWIGNTILVVNTSMESGAYFGIAYIFYNVFMMFPAAIIVPLLPKISELSVSSPESIESTMTSAIRMSSILLFPFLLAFGLFTTDIISNTYGPSYVEAATIVFLMLSACFVNTLSSIASTVCVGMGKMVEFVILQTTWTVAFLVFSFWLVPEMGLLGIGIAFLSSHAILLSTVFVVSRRSLGVNLNHAYLIAVGGSTMLILACASDEMFSLGSLAKTIIILTATLSLLLLARVQKTEVLGWFVKPQIPRP